MGVAKSEDEALAEWEGDPLNEGEVEALGEGVGNNEVEGIRVAQDTLAPFEGLVTELPVEVPQRVRVGVGVTRVVSVLDKEEVRQVEGVAERVVEREGEAEWERVPLPDPDTEGDKVTLADAVAACGVGVRWDEGEEDRDTDPDTDGLE